MKNSGLNNLITTLRDSDIQQLNAFESMNYEQMYNYLSSIDIDASQPGTVERAAKLVSAHKAAANSVPTIANSPKGLNSNYSNNKPKFATRNSVQKQKTKQMGTLTSDSRGMMDVIRAPKSAAIFDITMTRNAAGIAYALPCPLFGALDYESSYKSVISDLIPLSTISYTVGESATGKGIRFTFTNSVGPATDYIEVECPQVPYKNLLRASQGSLLMFSENKINISNVAIQGQFTSAVTIVKNSIFGKLEKDSFTPNQFKSDLQNQNDIRTITLQYEIDQETSIVYMIAASAGFIVTQTSYIASFETIRA